MYLPDYKTIKFEQQERIDQAAAMRSTQHRRSIPKRPSAFATMLASFLRRGRTLRARRSRRGSRRLRGITAH